MSINGVSQPVKQENSILVLAGVIKPRSDVSLRSVLRYDVHLSLGATAVHTGVHAREKIFFSFACKGLKLPHGRR